MLIFPFCFQLKGKKNDAIFSATDQAFDIYSCVMHDCIVFLHFVGIPTILIPFIVTKKHFRFLRFLVKLGKINIRTQL